MRLKIVASNAIVAGTLLTALATAPKHLLNGFEKKNSLTFVAETKNLGTQLHLSTHLVKLCNTRYGDITFYEE